MGIGAAFATGLVKGFTQNIQEEKARRLSEKEKVDAIQNLVLKSYLSGDTTKARFNSVTNLIKESRKEYEDRTGKIDIFGRSSDGIDLDFSKLQGTLGDVTDDTLRIGKVTLDMPEGYFEPNTDPREKATMFMDAISRETKGGTDTSFYNDFDDASKEAFSKLYRGHLNQYLRGRNYTSEGQKIGNVNPAKELDIHNSVADFLEFGKNDQYEIDLSAAALSLNMQSLPNDYIVLPKGMGVNKNGAVAIPLSKIGIKTADQREGLEKIAAHQGYDNTAEFMYMYSTQVGSLQGLVKGLKHAGFYSKNNVMTGGKTMQERYNVGEYLLTTSGLSDDGLARAYSLLPFVRDDRDETDIELERAGLGGAEKKPFNKEFKEITGVDLDDFQKNTQAIFSSRTRLQQLTDEIKRSGIKTESGLAKVFMTIYGFGGDTGTIDQAMSLLGGRFKDEKSEARVKAFLASEIGTGEVSDSLAAARTLAFIAAGDLARAEDPSGRLSDQDFIRNYKKLGIGTSGTLNNQLASIAKVQEEIEAKYQEVNILS